MSKQGDKIQLKATADWHIFADHSLTHKLPLYVISTEKDLLFIATEPHAELDECQQIYEQDVEPYAEPSAPQA